MLDKMIFLIACTVTITIVMAGIVYTYRRKLKAGHGIVAALLIILLILLSWQAYDNNRVIVVQDSVYIPGLPPAFDGFAILQVTDLHGKCFGKNQINLTSRINTLQYDMIAFTGDMETRSGDFGAFIKLLEGIKNKDNLFYVNGNEDRAYHRLTGIKTGIGHELEANGCVLLDKPCPIIKGGQTLWLVDDLSTIDLDFNPYQAVTRAYLDNDADYCAYSRHFSELRTMAYRINGSQDLIIALTHIPHTQTELERTDPPLTIWDCDLILAGHYHGGQIRIPIYGAPFIPARAPFLQNLFPDQRYVNGLAPGHGTQQYISRGLGASNVPFRLFNTPEINLLILKAI